MTLTRFFLTVSHRSNPSSYHAYWSSNWLRFPLEMAMQNANSVKVLWSFVSCFKMQSSLSFSLFLSYAEMFWAFSFSPHFERRERQRRRVQRTAYQNWTPENKSSKKKNPSQNPNKNQQNPPISSIRKDCKGSRSVLPRLNPKAAELYSLYHLLVVRKNTKALIYLTFVWTNVSLDIR